MANFAILRVGKLKSAGQVNGMLKHNFRDIETPNADPERTAENEHLTATSVQDGMKRYRERLPDKVRKNAVHALDYMITTSPDASAKDNEQALQVAYEWLCDKHGKENIIMASKHRDETTPHAHFLVVPIDEKGKLNARKFIGGTKHRMSELQDEFIEEIHKKGIDLERGLKGSKATHTRIKDFYAQISSTEPPKTPQIASEELKPKKKTAFSKESIDEMASRVNKSLKPFFEESAQEITSLRVANAQEKARSERAEKANKSLSKKALFYEKVIKPLSEKDQKDIIATALKRMPKARDNDKDIER